ncbi:MAG TPA: PspC domain-containing protein [Hyphomonadaceae bacterium]|jgi:phage shock protein C|nr:PspC domain-containing protein [Hyphomonadaceae bacterium]
MSRKYWKRHGRGCGWNRDSAASATWGEGGFGGRNFRILSGLRRDPYRGRVSGVCAGIAGYYGLNLKLIRVLMIVAAFINPFLAIGGYALATWLIQPMPEPRPDGGRSEANVGTSAEREKAAEEELPPELRFAALKDKFRDLEERTGGMETLVTSSEFRLRRDFKEMGEGRSDDSAPTPRPQYGAGPNARPPMMGLIG